MSDSPITYGEASQMLARLLDLLASMTQKDQNDD